MSCLEPVAAGPLWPREARFTFHLHLSSDAMRIESKSGSHICAGSTEWCPVCAELIRRRLRRLAGTCMKKAQRRFCTAVHSRVALITVEGRLGWTPTLVWGQRPLRRPPAWWRRTVRTSAPCSAVRTAPISTPVALDSHYFTQFASHFAWSNHLKRPPTDQAPPPPPRYGS